MEALIAKMRLLAKAEVILVRLHLRRAVRQVSFVLVGALFGLMALALLVQDALQRVAVPLTPPSASWPTATPMTAQATAPT